MNHRIAYCVGLAALGAAAIMATPVQAQVYLEPDGQGVPPPQYEYGGLPPSEILMAVRSSGLRPLTQPARLGPQRYAVLASDNMGGQLRVVVHAHTGRILHASPAHDPRFAYHPVRPRGFIPTPAPQHGVVTPPPTYSAAPPPDLRTPSAPPPPPPRMARTAPAPQTPPAAAPSHNQSLAGAPDVTGSVPTRPARTPLPRPRPTMAANDTSAAATPAAATPTQARPVETSPEADVAPAAQSAPAAPSEAPAKPAPTETQMVPVAPLD